MKWPHTSKSLCDKRVPKSEGFDTILVVVDRFSKYSHFLPLKHPFTAKGVAQVFLENVVKLHGVPRSIVSNKDKVFTSAFWKSIPTYGSEVVDVHCISPSN